jgi:formamidopyrimidine-DNA glycosylase
LPELAEIESLRRTIAPALIGHVLRVAAIGPYDMRARGGGRGEGHRTKRNWMNPPELLDGATIQSIARHGKRLAIIATDGRCLVVQLGMSGQLIAGDDCDDSHRHVTWLVTKSIRGQGRVPTVSVPLIFRDPRRFGGLTAYGSITSLYESWNEDLGPDALTIQAQTLRSAMTGARAIKVALLDQAMIAGVGNIYADESLHVAGIDPRMQCDQLSPKRVTALALAIRTILNRAINHGGSTLRDYRSGLGATGTAQALHAVYGRAGEPCLSCGESLHETRLGGRTTVWCRSCQPGVSGSGAAGRK